MLTTGKTGILRVMQPGQKSSQWQDFDASEYTYAWVVRGGVSVLQVQHTHQPNATADSMDFTEFSAPAAITFIPERP